MIIAIDGLGVNGKSTLAKKISSELKFKNFNTGAIYRCIALEIIDRNLDIEKIDDVITKLKDINIDFADEKVLLNGGNFIKPINAIEIDTTNLNISEVYDLMMKKIREKIK